MEWIISIIIALILTSVFVDIVRSLFEKPNREVEDFLEEHEKLRIKNLPTNNK